MKTLRKIEIFPMPKLVHLPEFSITGNAGHIKITGMFGQLSHQIVNGIQGLGECCVLFLNIDNEIDYFFG